MSRLLPAKMSYECIVGDSDWSTSCKTHISFAIVYYNYFNTWTERIYTVTSEIWRAYSLRLLLLPLRKVYVNRAASA
jgi:hypothetical protein